jgi:surfactin family lipopeptide synthetase A
MIEGVHNPMSVGQLSDAKRQLIETYLCSDGLQTSAAKERIARRPTGEQPPLSSSQRQVWVHSQMAGNVPIYNEPVTIYRRGPLEVAVLERCLTEILRRHEIWRTTFDTVNGDPIQVVQASPERFPLRMIDLRAVSPSDREVSAMCWATEDAGLPFDLKKGPLLRAILIRTDEEEYRLYMTFHQIIFDAVSVYRALLPELATLYEAFSAGRPSPLPEPTLQYGDFAYWQQKSLAADAQSEQLSFWCRKLSGELPVLQWPNGRARPAYQAHRGTIQRFKFDSRLIAPLKEFCARVGVSSYSTLLASYAALLSRYTQQRDIVIGGLSAGRRRSEVEAMPGYFVNPLALRIDLSGNPTFRQLVGRARDTVLDALANDEVPFESIVEALPLRPDPSRNPIFQLILSQQPPMPSVAAGWDLVTEEVSNGGSKLDMTIVLDERPDTISGPITYNPDLFDAATVTRMVEHWQTLLAGALATPDRGIAELPLLTESERNQILIDWNNTQLDFPPVCLHELIEAQVERTPDAVAVTFEDQQLSYRELNARANQLGHYLQKLGVGPEVLVGICVERSLEMLVGLLGILKAGGTYVPLDPNYPKDRLAFMVEDSGLKVLLTQEHLRAKLSEFPAESICLDSQSKALSQESFQNCSSQVEPHNSAYVIYTSGSTGKPKGVQISHRSLVNFLTSMQAKPQLSAKDTLLAVTTISFDIAGLELYLPLTVGGRVVLVSREIAADGQRLREKLATSGVTCMQATPATWRLLLESEWQGSKGLKILCGGEAMPRELMNRLAARASSVWNMYGPTETTIWSTMHEVTSTDGPIPIGRPIANTQIYILDKCLQPVPVGVPGELYIGGTGLARGYLNLPELTAERFIPNPFAEPGARLYKTGDLARFLPSGDVEYLGRTDHQVKIRGFRIELGEIEAAISEFPSVRQVVVVAREDAPGDKRLVAYLVPADAEKFQAAQLRDFLKRKLPEYMVPAAFVFLEALPLSSNGKVDRRALPAPGQPDGGTNAKFLGPRDDWETRLAKIWEEILHIPNIGIRQNLFELGAHSLLVARMLARIEREFGKRLSFASVLGAPTIEQLVPLLRNQSAPTRFTHLVPIQPAGSKPPFFCIGGGFFFRPLSQQLGIEQPVIGVHLDESIINQRHMPDTFEELAGYMVEAICKQQPQGPYFLGGFCVYGTIAYETARRLVNQGHQVALLAMFDGRNPAYFRTNSNGHGIGGFWKRGLVHFQELWQLERAGAVRYIAKVPKELWRKIRTYGREVFSEIRARRRPAQLTGLDRLFFSAERKYKPKPYSGRVVLFRADTKSDGALSGWRDVLNGPVEVYETLGTHMAMFFEPYVNQMASRLAACIDKAGEFVTRGNRRNLQ